MFQLDYVTCRRHHHRRIASEKSADRADRPVCRKVTKIAIAIALLHARWLMRYTLLADGEQFTVITEARRAYLTRIIPAPVPYDCGAETRAYFIAQMIED